MDKLGKALAGIGVASVAGYLGYVFNEKRTPSPRYRSVQRDGAFELRHYPALLVASTEVVGAREPALQAGFRTLANYIFAKSRGGEKIEMTTPVVQDQSIAMTSPVVQDRGATGAWRTRFVMPVKFTRETLPLAPAGVTIDDLPARRVAAVRFNGGPSERQLAAKESELREWIGQRGLSATGPAEYAYYNSPMILPPLRRNEVLIPVG